MIHHDNSVWFHDHAPDEACNKNCYEHVDTVTSQPWRYFLRINGDLREVHPLTLPHRHNGGAVKVRLVASGEVLLAEEGSLIIHR